MIRITLCHDDYDDLDFELGPAPHYIFKLKYPKYSVFIPLNVYELIQQQDNSHEQ